jgi:hypothetical protein
MPRNKPSPLKRLVAPLLVLPFLAAGGLYALEYLTSDAATRLAFQIRNQSLLLRMSGQPARTFTHSPTSWPSGVPNDYRIEIKEGRNPAYLGQRVIGVARNLTEPTWFTTTYHMNFVKVPLDLKVSHLKGEDTLVTLEKKDGVVLLTGLK